MTFEETKLAGVFIINNFNVIDNRGSFVKTFNEKIFFDNKIKFNIKESYYSMSKKDVIRGMHFQLPNAEHEKLVYVASGEIIDVVVDLRKKSSTYKEYISVKLSSENKKSIFIPKGLAHGFKSLADGTITVYNVATEYNQSSDSGINLNSFSFDWQDKTAIISERDLNFISLNEFCKNNPF